MTVADARELLRQMLLIRRFEEKAAQMYGLRKIGGFCHLYIGQEAVAVGSIAALELARDYVVTAYRDHGHALACGMDPKPLMAELFGKATGCSKGKGGSMHFFDAARHFLGGNGIVGAQIPVATGVGSRLPRAGRRRRGRSASSATAPSTRVRSTRASTWRGSGTCPSSTSARTTSTAWARISAASPRSRTSRRMGASYGIPGRQVNGMDVLEVHREMSEAVARVRAASVPELLEIRTYRYRGHSMSDPAKYRTPDELESYKRQDPIADPRRRHCKAKGELDDAGLAALDDAAKAACEEAVRFAEESPEPAAAALYEDILA